MKGQNAKWQSHGVGKPDKINSHFQLTISDGLKIAPIVYLSIESHSLR